MIRTHYKSPLTFLKSFVFAVVFTAVSACSSDRKSGDFVEDFPEIQGAHTVQQVVENPSPYAGENNFAHDDYRLPVQGREFFHALLSLNESLMEGGQIHVQIPSIWIFSPQKELTRMVLDNDALETLSTEFSIVDPQIQNITCQQIDASVAKATGKEWSMGCENGKWTALLLTGENSECEESCPKYESAAVQAGKEHHDLLQVKTLVLNF